jgi:3alpha(or 20beta)-hydroxysteroid dehydrogenase
MAWGGEYATGHGGQWEHREVPNERACERIGKYSASANADSERQRGGLMSVYDLTGRKALVTGGARGLGEGMARALAGAGAAVVIADIREDLGKETASSLREQGANVEFVALDVTSDDSWAQAVPQAIAHLSGLDILVNNAGIEITSLLIDLEPEGVRRMLEVNVLGTALGIKHGFRAMRPGGAGNAGSSGGAIVNVASVAATIAFPGIAGYSATKSAVDRLTRVAAMESGKLGYGVRVNCVYPGLVPTEMGNQLAVDCAAIGLFPSPQEAAGAVVGLTPLGRLGEVPDIADAVVFLASDGARFITGAGLPVDGGMGM